MTRNEQLDLIDEALNTMYESMNEATAQQRQAAKRQAAKSMVAAGLSREVAEYRAQCWFDSIREQQRSACAA